MTVTESSYAQAVTAPPIQVLIINPDATYELRTVEQDLKVLQGLVGGWIEAIRTDAACFWANEDGKANECPTNSLATYLWWNFDPKMEGLDVLRGPIFLTGHDDGAGNSLPVPDEVIEYFEWMRAIYVEHKDDG
jgi:hypothetical protein